MVIAEAAAAAGIPGAIRWCAFFGAWLLFAGPLNQAAIELREEEFDHEGFSSKAAAVTPPPPVSGWWWLFPPAAYLLSRRRQRLHRVMVFQALDVHQREQWVAFMTKAQAWLTVASGAFLIALKETWELIHHYEWDTWVFWLLVVVSALAGVLNTAFRMARAGHINDRPDGRRPPRSRQEKHLPPEPAD